MRRQFGIQIATINANAAIEIGFAGVVANAAEGASVRRRVDVARPVSKSSDPGQKPGHVPCLEWHEECWLSPLSRSSYSDLTTTTAVAAATPPSAAAAMPPAAAGLMLGRPSMHSTGRFSSLRSVNVPRQSLCG